MALISFSGAEIILILAILLIISGVVAVVVVSVMAFASRKKPGPVQPPPLSAQAQDLDHQLRMLAKLKEDGVITEEDFSAKKRALLGIE